MVDIRITYETLFDLLRREKNREELQTLDKDFYEQVLAYLKEKKEAITRKGDELFASAEREKLKIQFQNIRRIIKELYERREKKIIAMAMSRARTGSDIIDTSALLPSEREYFEEQVELFVKYKDKVLDSILEVKEFNGTTQASQATQATQATQIRAPIASQSEAKETNAENHDSEQASETSDQPGFATASELARSVEENAETRKVKILDQLPEFMGRNGAVLGPFEEGEEVELDSLIAELLVKRGSAEPC